MRIQWLTQTGTAAEVIVVFGGWAVGPDGLRHLGGAQDVLFVDDYRDLDGDLPDLSAYRTRRLIAWSFGVAGYGHWQAARRIDPFTRKTALSGTLTPVDRLRGIPPAVVAKTRDTLSDTSFAAFLARCYGAPCPDPADLDIAARQAELSAVAARGPAPDPHFDCIVIPSRDRIFPPASMARAWADQAARVVAIDAPHAPFALWHLWDDIP
ncbi:MAG: DUF452 family protein [Rhodobacteraceae bacterium]|nr:DUF452 family protein [Paracoccaceae bacterium]